MHVKDPRHISDAHREAAQMDCQLQRDLPRRKLHPNTTGPLLPAVPHCEPRTEGQYSPWITSMKRDLRTLAYLGDDGQEKTFWVGA